MPLPYVNTTFTMTKWLRITGRRWIRCCTAPSKTTRQQIIEYVSGDPEQLYIYTDRQYDQNDKEYTDRRRIRHYKTKHEAEQAANRTISELWTS